MKILFITQLKNNGKIFNDIISDSLLLGLREVYKKDVIDFPGAWYMYQDEVTKRNLDITKLWGSGFTYYNNLDNFNSIDRSDIINKIKNNYFEFIIYGSFTRSNLYFNEALKSKSKIILIDGEDHTDTSLNINKKIIYFKRELIKEESNLFPINVTIPKNKIISQINKTPKNLLAPLIPHRYKTYIYKKEQDYYNMWNDSLFGISYVHGGWWEAVRYYEMLMNGCVPLILNIKNCPNLTLTKLPKSELIEVFDRYSWILNQYNPLRIYKKKFLSFEKFILFLKYISKKKYNSQTFLTEFPEINEIRERLLEHTKKNLTTEHIAKYVIQSATKFYSSI